MIEALKSDHIVAKIGGRFKLTALIQKRMLELMDGARPLVDIFVNCSRATLDEVRKRGWEAPLRAAGVTVVADTCVYVSALLQADIGTVMTNSGKCAYYAPGNLGVEIAYGSLTECAASARAGKVVRL